MDRTKRARMSLAVLLVAAATLSSPVVSFAADIKASINAVLGEPYLRRVEVGIKVVQLGETPEKSVTLYERGSTTPRIPASNLKLITTAAALDGLGAEFVFRTLLVQNGQKLAIVGDGDPTMGDAELLQKLGWRSTTLYEKWAEALAGAGKKSFDSLSYDDGIFDAEYAHANWPANQLHLRYVAGVSGLNFNVNCLDFYLRPGERGTTVDYTTDPPTAFAEVQNGCVSGSKNAVWLTRADKTRSITLRGQTNAANGKAISVTIDEPPLFTATVLKEVLGRSDISVGNEVTRDTTIRGKLSEWQTLAVSETPIDHVLHRANKDSMNLYAEALCKRLGAAKTPTQPGSWQTGTAAIGAFLQSIGVAPGEFSLDDGCGLSRRNTISPNAIVRVLEHEHFMPHRATYAASLAIAGVDGTLKERFEAIPDLRQRVVGKSGFIDGVSSLSGYVKSRDGATTYAFSILFNGIAEGTNSNAKRLQERIVAAIAD